jgi:hypothetical protein
MAWRSADGAQERIRRSVVLAIQPVRGPVLTGLLYGTPLLAAMNTAPPDQPTALPVGLGGAERTAAATASAAERHVRWRARPNAYFRLGGQGSPAMTRSRGGEMSQKSCKMLQAVEAHTILSPNRSRPQNKTGAGRGESCAVPGVLSNPKFAREVALAQRTSDSGHSPASWRRRGRRNRDRTSGGCPNGPDSAPGKPSLASRSRALEPSRAWGAWVCEAWARAWEPLGA